MTETRKRLVAVGAKMFTLPFGALGFEQIEADPASAEEILRGLIEDPSVGVVVCGESLVPRPMTAEFRDLCARSGAAVQILPDDPEAMHDGYELTRGLIEEAAGVDLLGPLAEETRGGEAEKPEARTEN